MLAAVSMTALKPHACLQTIYAAHRAWVREVHLWDLKTTPEVVDGVQGDSGAEVPGEAHKAAGSVVGDE